jgi:hypothetical protein
MIARGVASLTATLGREADASELLEEDGEAGVGEGVVGIVGDAVAGEGESVGELTGVFEGSDEGVGGGGVGRV